MTSAAPKAGDFLALTTSTGSEVYVLPTRKFKTKLLRLHVRARLSPSNVVRALVPNLLRRGSSRRPSMLAVSRALEGLYGSAWSSSVYKLGEEQVLAFRLDTVEERFLPGHPRIFEPAVAVARELILDPHLVNGTFPTEVFEQERLNHKRDIEAQYNDKLSWAFQRLLEAMFPDEPYGQPVLGTAEQADALTPADPLRGWRELTNALPVRVFAVGDFDPARVVELVEKEFPLGRQVPMAPAAPARASTPAGGGRGAAKRDGRSAVQQPRMIVEEDQLSQSKLLSGRLVDLAGLTEREFDALRVYAGVLGGGFHSRLFQSVREKHSLAYFASASLDRLRGVLFTSCGIDAADREQCCELVEREIDSLRTAPPRPDELDQTKNLIISGSRGMFDSAGGMVETLEAGLAAGRVRSLDQVCQSVAAVTAADVERAARRVGPVQITYCLAGAARHAEAEVVEDENHGS